VCWGTSVLGRVVALRTRHTRQRLNLLLHTHTRTQQCLNLLQGDTKPIRRVVESRFEEIKGVSESKRPFFEIGVSDW